MAVDSSPLASPQKEMPAVCWRCRLEVVDATVACEHCGAPPREAADEKSARRGRRWATEPVPVMIGAYVLLLGTSLLYASVSSFSFELDGPLDEQTQRRLLTELAVIELIDAAVVLAVFLLCGWQAFRMPRPSLRRQVVAYLGSIAVLTGLLALNVTYHRLLRETLLLPVSVDELTRPLTWLVLVTYCIQPALVEEAFCRGFALGALRPLVGSGAAIWISATMFGLLHIAMPLSIPYLIVFGAALGYLRVSSGSLILPAVVHFAHNLAVIWIDS